MRLGMGAAAMQHLTQPAQLVLRHAISNAHERGHAQVQPLHVASMLLVHGGPLLRQACVVSHPQSPHELAQCRALELCFNVALDRLPQSSSSSSSNMHPLGYSHALIAALKRAQTHQRRGCPEQQQPPVLAVKVEIEQLIISILEDPSVSRVMREAGFSSTQVKVNLENAIGLSGLGKSGNANQLFPTAGPSGFQQMTTLEYPNSTTQDREVRQVLEVLLRPKKNNPIIVSNSLESATTIVKQLQALIGAGKVPEPLQKIPILAPELSSRVFESCTQQEMDQKLLDLNKSIDDCMPQGCILHIGDLQWLVDPILTKTKYCPAQHWKEELGHILERHRNGRFWAMGIASTHSWQNLQPSVESKWGLQHVLAASPVNFNLAPRLSTRIVTTSSSGLFHGGCMSARPSIASVWLAQESSEVKETSCCSECRSCLEAECQQLQLQETASVQGCRSASLGVDSEGSKSLPPWLQKVKDESDQEKSKSCSQKLQEVHQKWHLFCRTSHLERHSNTVATPARDGTFRLLPECSMNANTLNNADTHGTTEANSTAAKNLNSRSPSAPRIKQPRWERYAIKGPQASLSDMLNTEMSVLGDVEMPPAVCRSSSNEGSGVTLSAEDSQEKMEMSQKEGYGQPVILEPSPFSRSRLRAVQECHPKRATLIESLPDPSLGGNPLRDRMPQGQSPMAISAVNSSKVITKLPSAMNSSQSLLQKPPLKSSSNQASDTSLITRPSPLHKREAADRLKHVKKGLMEMVPWQDKVVPAIATTVVNARFGMGKSRGLSAKADTWLLFLGPDRFGKRLIVNTLAELVVGTDKKPIYFGLLQEGRNSLMPSWGREDQEADGPRYRGLTQLDSVVNVLKANPLSVLLLEDIDQADPVLRMNLRRAMETGKLADTSGRHISVRDSIFVMTSRLGTESISKAIEGNPFSERKLASLGGVRMKVVLEPPVDKEVVFKGGANVSVVKDVAFSQIVDNFVGSTVVHGGSKRKADIPPDGAAFRGADKRMKVVAQTGRSVALDLNLSAEENEAVLTATATCQQKETSIGPDCTEGEVKACNSDPVLSAVQDALSPNFCSVVDDIVVFDSYDMIGQANWILSQLSSVCSGLTPKAAAMTMEVDLQLLQHLVALTWRTPRGNQVFVTWVKEKLKASLIPLMAETDVSERKILKFVYADCFSRELRTDSDLPLQIEVDSIVYV